MTHKDQDDAKADPARIVEALKTVAGDPPGVRASFAKGWCVTGAYHPSPRAHEVTCSPSFTNACEVLARFSVGGGLPAVADTNALVLRGLSLRLTGDGSRSDLLVENAPVHFARTLDQMLAFLRARAPGADGKPDPERVRTFSEANPETLNQARYIAARPLPGSFAGVAYWGVHAFPVTNAAGVSRFVKFKLAPVAGEIGLSEDEARALPPDFLRADLERRFQAGGVGFDILALLDRPGDPVLDVTTRWPDEDEREAVPLGRVTISQFADQAACDQAIFNPGVLADGVGHPPDEMFAARLEAYVISLARRRREGSAARAPD
ncbi:MAG: catalase family peroxidase [Caulobacter sp.]|nr:catalase family peroxidase [Caulobacter sp.]